MENAKQLAKTVYVALNAANGQMTRQKIQHCFTGLPWKPTNGELTDAIKHLQAIGRIKISWKQNVLPMDRYLDSGELIVSLIPKQELVTA